MSNFYLKAVLPNKEVVFYFLDSTAQIEVSYSSSLSQYPLANGETVADNYTHQPTQFSFTGRISDIKSANPGEHIKSTKDYLDGLETIRKLGTPISVLYHMGRPEAKNCYFTNLTVRQDSSTGYAGVNESGAPVNAYQITFTLQQTLYARGAVITTAPAAQFKDAFQEKVTASSTTKEVVPESPGEQLLREGAQQYFIGYRQAAQSLDGDLEVAP
jgi:hypothetical protein